MNLISIEKIDKEPKVALAPDIPYICPICLRQFEGSKVVEREMIEEGKDFFTRYSAQLVNHVRKNHMRKQVDVFFKKFKSKEENKNKNFEISYGMYKKLNVMVKELLLEEIPKKFPKTVSANLIDGMLKLKDNNIAMDVRIRTVRNKLNKEAVK